MKPLVLALAFLFITQLVYAQFQFEKKHKLKFIDSLENASFEMRQEQINGSIPMWEDCGLIKYSPPTVHRTGEPLFNVDQKASHGEQYISMVARRDETWEAISQAFSNPLKADTRYIFGMHVSNAKNMKSQTDQSKDEMLDFSRALILKIYGGEYECDKSELIFISERISSRKWTEIVIQFTPKDNMSWITIEAYYDNTLFKSYNGNIMIDNISPVYEILE